MRKKKFSPLLFAACAILAILFAGSSTIIWLEKSNKSTASPKLPSMLPVLEAESAFGNSLLEGPRQTEFHTLVYRDGTVFATKVLDKKTAASKKCPSIPASTVEKTISFILDPIFLQKFSYKDRLSSSGIPGQSRTITVNYSSQSRKISESNASLVAPAFDEFWERFDKITSWCTFEDY